MKKLEIINSAIASLEAELVVAEQAVAALDQEYRDQIASLWKSKLEGLLSEGDQVVNDYGAGVRVTRNIVRTKRDGEQYDYAQEIFSISRSEYGEDKTGFNMSTYSTTIDNNFEFDRLITVGKVAAFIKENREALRTEFPVNKTYNSDANKERYRIENEIRTLRNEKSEIERKTVADKLETEGVEFAPNKYGSFPSLEVRWDWTIRSVFKVKVLKKTASGKSADLEIVTRHKTWEGDFQDSTTTVEKVRMDKVESLIAYNRESIVA